MNKTLKDQAKKKKSSTHHTHIFFSLVIFYSITIWLFLTIKTRNVLTSVSIKEYTAVTGKTADMCIRFTWVLFRYIKRHNINIILQDKT